MHISDFFTNHQGIQKEVTTTAFFCHYYSHILTPGSAKVLCHSQNLPLFFLPKPYCSLLVNHSKSCLTLHEMVFFFFLGWPWGLTQKACPHKTHLVSLFFTIITTCLADRSQWDIAMFQINLIHCWPHELDHYTFSSYPFLASKFVPDFLFPRHPFIILSSSLSAQDSNSIKKLFCHNLGS